MTFAGNVAEFSEAVHFVQELYELGSLDATNLVTLETNMRAAASGDFSLEAQKRLRDTRSAIASRLAPSSLRNVFLPHLLNLGATALSPERANVAQLVRDLQDYMVLNYLTIQSRNLTLGTPSAAAGNTGDGTITRCVTDRHGYQLENVWLEAKTLKCVADQGSVKKGQEVFKLSGAPFKVDALQLGGSGASGSANFLLKALDARRVGNYLRNPSFDTGHGVTVDDTAPSAISGWEVTSGSIGDLRMRSNASYVYRTAQGVSQGWGVEFVGDVTLKQTFGASGMANPKLNDSAPHYCAFAVKRLASATGSCVLSLGSASVTLDISTLTNDTWYLLIVTPNSQAWYSNWAQDGAGVQIAVSSLATGTFAIDDGEHFPFTLVDGTYFAAHGGPTPWKVGDSFSFTDALVGSEAVIQHWLWRAGYESLPHATAATQVVAAGGRTLTFADADPDTITASSGDFTADGYAAGMELTVAGTASNDGTYTIASVTATVITLESSEALAAEGPLSGGETLDAGPTFTDP